MTDWQPTTPLQTLIAEAIANFPNDTDEEIAARVVNPDTGKTVSKQYVNTLRQKMGEPVPRGDDFAIKVEPPSDARPTEAKPAIGFEVPTDLFGEPVPRAAPVTDQPAGIEMETIQPMVNFIFAKIGDMTGFDGWKLTPQESVMFCQPLTVVINKYIPQVMEQYGAELMLAIAAITIIGGKLLSYRAWQKEQEPMIPKPEEKPEPKPEPEEAKETLAEKASQKAQEEADKDAPPPMLGVVHPPDRRPRT